MTAALWVALIIVAALVGFGIGNVLGTLAGDRRAQARQSGAAAAICPFCTAAEAPAKRFSDARGRVQGTEHAGDYADGFSPVSDANRIIALAVDRVRRRGVY